MKEQKLETMNNLFEGKNIRSIWDNEKEDYYFSVVDVIAALTDSSNPRNYWNMLKRRMTEEEKSEVYTKCVHLKLKASDGKSRETDVLDTKGILRLIESVPSPKAEPFKVWLANLGSDRIDEIFDPEIAIKRAISYYQKKGLKENKDIAKRGGNIAKITKDKLEKELNENIITSNNNLNFKYVDKNKLTNKDKSL